MKITDSNTPLHLLKPKYPIAYQVPKKKHIIKKLYQILEFLNEVTPSNLIHKKTKKKISKGTSVDKNTTIPESAFRLTSYEWGVTYAGLIKMSEITGIESFSKHAFTRLKMISDLANFYFENKNLEIDEQFPIHSVLHPAALDDSGAICAAMIKAQQINPSLNLNPLIDNFIDYISNKQFRFEDNTLARNRPYPNTLWLDDLFMSVPALAFKANSENNNSYFDDAVHQVIQFYKRMFVPENNLFMHGWVRDAKTHPAYFWARANGWAVMALVELLSVLPKNHKEYETVLNQFEHHINGLISLQSGTGFWHQILNRNDSYLETSATAIITYSIAKAINENLIDKLAYSPIAILGWNAIATKITSNGQVDGTCVGTGMGFDLAFYYHRPINKFAAHGYGPMFLAGAEIIRLLQNNKFHLVEGALQLKLGN